MTSFNKIILMGHLTRDPELRVTPGGTAVATFCLATNHRFRKGQETHEDVCYLDCVTFGRQAETVCAYLRKGQAAFVEGRVQWHTWETDDGYTRSKHTIMVHTVQFLSQNSSPHNGHAERARSAREMHVPF
jgi:single-strand DNA-binding protein